MVCKQKSRNAPTATSTRFEQYSEACFIPDHPLAKNHVIPAKDGIQMIRSLPQKKRDNIALLSASRGVCFCCIPAFAKMTANKLSGFIQGSLSRTAWRKTASGTVEGADSDTACSTDWFTIGIPLELKTRLSPVTASCLT